MNHSIYSADRTTHLKIVVIALLGAIAIAIMGLSARAGTATDTAALTKAARSMVMTSSAALTR